MTNYTTNKKTNNSTNQEDGQSYINALLQYITEAENPVRLYQIIDTGENPDYFITDTGEFISTFGGVPRVLQQEQNNFGYYRIEIRHKKYFTHKTVAKYFNDNPHPEEKTIVHHIDSQKENNNYLNLRHIDPFTHNLYHAMKRKYKDADVELQ